jgi:apolipoprotein N-acyltransferase
VTEIEVRTAPREPRPGPGTWSWAARLALALLAGAATAFAHPPFGLLPGLLGYPLLMILTERSRTVRGGFWMGWLAGFAYFAVGCWWVAEAFLVNPAQAWMAPFAASLLPAGLGLFWGAATALHRRFGASGVRGVLSFAAFFCIMEWLRGHVLTGFPWNPAGATWQAGSAPSQFAAVVGVYGLGLVTVLAVCAAAPLLSPGPKKLRVGAAVAGVLALVALFVGGAVRLTGAEVRPSGTIVRVVQADVDQESKWSPEAYRDIVQRYVALTARPGPRVPDVIVWPEGALPNTANAVFAPGAWEARAIVRSLQPGQTLLAGLSRGEPDPLSPTGGQYFNSLMALKRLPGDGGMRVEDVYDKHRLVPFGEFLPAGALMSRLGVRSLVHVPADFSHGPRPRTLRLEGLPNVQPLICYESLFPGFVGRRSGAAWIANVSNDAWFGRTSGPLQHLNLASYRAIETGLPVVRATPTGTSAVIDPWGRVVGDKRLDPGESGVIDAALPQALTTTPYAMAGDLPWLAGVIACLLGGLSLRRRRAPIPSPAD